MQQLYSQHSASNQNGFIHRGLLVGIACLIIFGAISSFRFVSSHAVAATPQIKSGIFSLCLDDYHSEHPNGAKVDAATCNNTSAQAWTAGNGTITHDTNDCLTVQNNGKNQGDKVIMASCNAAPGQVWLRDREGYFNPNSGLCLTVPSSEAGAQLTINTCQNPTQPYETWTPVHAAVASDSCTVGSEGQKIACIARQQWSVWQTGSPDHESLLNTYTDSAPYEQWCADFVSYVYKQAGYPFTGGEADDWNESNANNIQNLGFTQHSAASGYIPQAGDVAYFDYNGGHVEIVVSGGQTPTFIYGDSATIDPTTGNGQMMANTITQDGTMGQVVYYLSPT